MREAGWKSQIKLWVQLIIGSGMLAFAVKCIYDPCQMVVGGFTGLAIIIKELTKPWFADGVPLGLTTILMNVPVFIVAYPLKGRRFVVNTLSATVALSIWLLILPEITIATKDYVLVAIFGGTVGGVGIGMVLAAGSATGGTDLIASLLQIRFPFYTVAQLMAILDGIIIIGGGFLFGFPVALYAVTSVYITAKVSDTIVLGTHYAKAVYIITDSPDQVAKMLLKEINRGVTGISGEGMYTGKFKKLLFCVVTKKEIVRLKKCVYQTDQDAFIIVSEATEVLGEGFRQS